MKIKSAVAAFLILSLIGCGTNQVIGNLELAVDAVSVALPLIGPAAGLPANVTAQIQTYLGATSKALGQSADILAGPGDDGQKAAQIVAVFAGIAVPAVPAQYQAIAQAVQQIAVLVSKFLATLPSPSTQPIALRAPGSTPVIPGKVTALSVGDRERLIAVRAKANAVITALK